MARRAWTSLALVSAVAVAMVAATSPAGAAPTGGAVCTSFTLSGLKYQWSAIGNVTCKQAKPWLVRILSHRYTKTGTRVAPKNGPRGFHCFATTDSKGRPSAGACYTGTLAFPKNGFQWLG